MLLRDHGCTDRGLYVPLHGLPEPHRQRVLDVALLVEESAFKLVGLEPRLIHRTADRGRTVTWLVCPDCGSGICNAARPDGRRVRAGTLDDTSWLRPTLHFWTRSKQPWVTLPEGGQIFETQPNS